MPCLSRILRCRLIRIPLVALSLSIPLTISAQDKESGLYRHLQKQAVAKLQRRSADRLAMKSGAEVQTAASDARAWLRSALGPWPEKTPLNAQVTGRLEGAGVKVEKILFESRPGHHVTAVLFLPTDVPPPWPGVIVPCGHSANGKAVEPYQRAAISLARAGMAALCYDPIGQGERLQALKADGKAQFSGSTVEHTRIGVGSQLVGLQTAHYRVWDGIRALDYLESRPDIIKDKLGCTGNSGGGTLTSFLMAVDDRIKAAAPSCYLTTYERLLETIGPQDAEQNIVGMIAAGYDHPDFVLARAPAPTLICVATRDFFDIDGAWRNYRENKKSYGTLGFGERVDLFEFDDTHGFSLPRRQAATRWMARWLRGVDQPIAEPEFPIFTDAQLQVTPTGQVLNLPGEKSVFALNAEVAAKLAADRKPLTAETARKVVSDHLKIATSIPAASVRPGRTIAPGLEEAFYDTADGFELATRITYVVNGQPVTEPPAYDIPVTIVVGTTPARIFSSASVVEKFMETARGEVPLTGKIVFLDVRGIGSSGGVTETVALSRDPNGLDWRESELARLLGQNLVGLRTYDIAAVLAAEALSHKDLGVLAYGPGNIWSLHAALLHPGVIRLVEKGAPQSSWSEAVDKPGTILKPSGVITGVLADYDLEDLRRLLRKP